MMISYMKNFIILNLNLIVKPSEAFLRCQLNFSTARMYLILYVETSINAGLNIPFYIKQGYK